MSISSWVPKTCLTPERVFLTGECPRPSSPSEATWPLLKTSASPPQISAYSSRGASSSTWEGLDPLLDSLSSLVVQDWAEPDCRLWCEVILRVQLRNQTLEPRDPPDPAEPSEAVEDGVRSTPSLSWRCIPPNTLVKVWDALTSLWKGDTPPCSGCHLL